MPGLHLNTHKTEEMLQFGTKSSRRAWHVIPAQEVKIVLYNLCHERHHSYATDRNTFRSELIVLICAIYQQLCIIIRRGIKQKVKKVKSSVK